eukprot:scaffold1036_cov169-Ochromonas_danica.AAC.3
MFKLHGGILCLHLTQPANAIGQDSRGAIFNCHLEISIFIHPQEPNRNTSSAQMCKEFWSDHHVRRFALKYPSQDLFNPVRNIL